MITQAQIDTFTQNAKAAGYTQAQIDAEIQRKYAEGIAAGGVPLENIQKDETLRAIQAQQVGQGLYKEPQTETEKKAAVAKQTAERTLRTLEDMYFGLDDGSKQILATAEQSGLGARLEGLSSTAKAKLFADYPDLKIYLDARQGARPTLARAAGDVGNLSKPEQEAAVASIPTGMSTPAEAIGGFNASRKRFGLPERDIQKELGFNITGQAQQLMAGQPQPITPTTQPTQPPNQPPANNPTDVLTYAQKLQQAQPQSAWGQFQKGFAMAPYRNLDNSNGSTAQKLAGGAETLMPLALGVIGRTAFGKPGSIVGAGVGKLAGEITGQGIENVAGIQKELPQQLLTQTATKPLTTAAQIALIEGVMSLLRPAKTALNIRSGLAGRATGLGSGDVVAEQAMNQPVASGLSKASQGARLEAIQNYAGKELTVPEILQAITREGRQAFGKTGDLKTKAAAEVNAVLNRALNEQLKQADLPTYLAHQLLVKPTQSVSHTVGRYLWPAVIGATAAGGASYMTSKMLGGGGGQ